MTFAKPQRRAHQHGFSVVALLVGVAVGLVVAAAAVAAVSQHARATNRLLVDASLTQALRTSTELITRHLRRAGHWRGATQAVWPAHGDTPRGAWPHNPHGIGESASESLRFSYSSPSEDGEVAGAPSPHDQFGLRLTDGTLEMAMGGGAWQALTDPAVMRVTAFDLSPRTTFQPMGDFCTRPCMPAAKACPPQLAITDIAVRIHAQSVAQPSVRRQSMSHVRLRNDRLSGQCAP